LTFLFADEGKVIEVEGEVLDLACYIHEGARGEGHKKCAEMCIKGGAPIGVITSDGKLYLIVEDHNNPKPYEEIKNYAAQIVKVKGTLYNRNGLQGIVISSVQPSKK
ncbi:MAG: hypothetical protein QXU40_03715, partial [Candidatus Pacearchaeota archaeon]